MKDINTSETAEPSRVSLLSQSELQKIISENEALPVATALIILKDGEPPPEGKLAISKLRQLYHEARAIYVEIVKPYPSDKGPLRGICALSKK